MSYAIIFPQGIPQFEGMHKTMHFFQGVQESLGVTKVVIISIMIDFTCDINKAALTVDAFFQIYLIILIPLLHFFL